MKFYDISIDLYNSMPSWPEELGFYRREKRHGSIRVSKISMSLHAGTHLDAPYHFLPEGKK